MNSVKGYKVFNPDWTCLDFQYEVGKTYKHCGEIAVCERGFHFCEKLADCFSYYNFDPANKVAEVVATGKVDRSDDDSKVCTDELIIVRELSWEEVLKVANSGNRNSGYRNSGNWNSGDWNSGDWNSGDGNSSDSNSGDWNSGSWNSGCRNSGNWNSGYSNSGDWNSGSWNSGDWNSGNWNSGVFNTNEPKILIFDQPTDWTYRDWRMSRACGVMRTALYGSLEWVHSQDMTSEEKLRNPQHETTGGFLRRSPKPDLQKWWDELSGRDQAAVKSLPNFDADKFKQITGIEV